jgi:hypothetical protein
MEPKIAIPVRNITGAAMSIAQPITELTITTTTADNAKMELSVHAICEEARRLGRRPM